MINAANVWNDQRLDQEVKGWGHTRPW